MTPLHASRVRPLEPVLWQLVVLLGAFAVGCAHQVRTEPLSATEHRVEAEREQRIASAHRAADAAEQRLAGNRTDDTPNGMPVMRDARSSTDSDWHLIEAARHALHGREHERAAQALERFEDEACHPLPASVRAACPIMTGVRAITQVPGGVRVTFRADVNTGQVFSLMRCHLAFARARGFAEVESCPLYVRGVELAHDDKGHVIEITAAEPAVVQVIRTRIGEVVSASH